MRELIRKLTGAFGPSGAEEPIRKVIRAEIEPLADEIRVDPLGSLIARKQCGDGKRILLDAHMDEIGVMVTYVDEKGFARFTRIGGVYTLNHVGGRVAFADGTVGVIGIEGKRKDPNKVPKFEQLYLDVGATSRDDCPVGVGDPAVFVRPFETQGTRLISKAMDDRIGCAVLIETLRRLEQTDHDVHFVFAVQEEVGMRGAHTATYGIDPDMAIAVDVTTTGDTPEARPMAVELGKGPAIKIKDAGMIAHPAVRDLMIQQAKKAEIPYQLEVLERGTTDAAAMQLVRAGVPSGCLSVPCRYVHTPSEMVDEQDVENSVQLLLEVLQAA
ncbi:MAG: M42 family peptidase [Chloroflexi bacterium]|nr:MAG: M42 family peptidase [Chloroflexota bacterium]RLC82881.1 MAG: M42 family peptidase [Chloroflexota bacterium]